MKNWVLPEFKKVGGPV